MHMNPGTCRNRFFRDSDGIAVFHYGLSCRDPLKGYLMAAGNIFQRRHRETASLNGFP